MLNQAVGATTIYARHGGYHPAVGVRVLESLGVAVGGDVVEGAVLVETPFRGIEEALGRLSDGAELTLVLVACKCEGGRNRRRLRGGEGCFCAACGQVHQHQPTFFDQQHKLAANKGNTQRQLSLQWQKCRLTACRPFRLPR
jgi:hypothetical protein